MVVGVHLNHIFPSLSALVWFRYIYKNVVSICMCLIKFTSIDDFFYTQRKTHSSTSFKVIDKDNFRNVTLPANERVNSTRIATLAFPSHMQKLKKCCWTQHFIRRGFTHAFLIRIIFHRDLSPLTSAAGRSSLKCISSQSQPWTSFSLYKSGLGIRKAVFFLKGKK